MMIRWYMSGLTVRVESLQGEVNSGRSEASSANDNNEGPVDDDPPPIGVNRDIIIIKKITEIVLRYGMHSGYVYKIPTINKCISTLSSLEIGACKESFWAGFCIPIHSFIEGLLSRYGLVLV